MLYNIKWHQVEKTYRKHTGKNMTKPTEAEVREAVKTLILWTGDNPDREGSNRNSKKSCKSL